MTEKPAKNTRGFILYNPIAKCYFFRVYGESDTATGRKNFTDYDLCAEDIEVIVEAGSLSLFEGDRNRLDWSSRVLGK